MSAPQAGDACSVCGGTLETLGVLGNTEHLNCRQCGAHFYGDDVEPLTECCGARRTITGHCAECKENV